MKNDKKKVGYVESMGLDKATYIDIEVNGKPCAMRKPSAMKQIEMEDKNVTIEGEVDMVGYISDVCGLVYPKITLEDVVSRISSALVVGEKELVFENISALKVFEIAMSGAKMVKDKNGNPVMKINQAGMFKEIIANTDEVKYKEEEFTYKEIKDIVAKFQELFDVTGAMNIYSTFQEKVQS
ncbi:MAG: hypothetical protein ACRC6E_03170 [Fusobacteriaceae bacterium]